MDCHPHPHHLPPGLLVVDPRIVVEATHRLVIHAVHAPLAHCTAQVIVHQVHHGLPHVGPRCIQPRDAGSVALAFSCAEPQFYVPRQVSACYVSHGVEGRARSLAGRLVPQASSSL